MIRRIGFVLVAISVLSIAWLGVTVWWGDPFTALYTRHEQHVLVQRLDRLDEQWAARLYASPAASSKASQRELLAAALRSTARSFALTLRNGQPLGRLVIPRIHLSIVVVQGTTTSDLEKGPGHYDAASGARTSIPGLGGVIAIAGHRTTFLHPFRHIDDLRTGDTIVLRMPYGVFRYRVYAHRVVLPEDWSILRLRPFEKLVLTACHPIYSASHRYVVFARLAGESVAS